MNDVTSQQTSRDSAGSGTCSQRQITAADSAIMLAGPPPSMQPAKLLPSNSVCGCRAGAVMLDA